MRLVPPHLPLRRCGPVSAGFPSPAQGYEDDPLDLNELLIPHPAATFFFRVKGQELLADGIRDGSILVVDRSVTPKPGSTVVADWNGDRTVLRMPSYLDGGDELRVWGVVTAVVTRLRP
ncbi:MAG: S24 family peptidase [Planctomycetota bacterium]